MRPESLTSRRNAGRLSRSATDDSAPRTGRAATALSFGSAEHASGPVAGGSGARCAWSAADASSEVSEPRRSARPIMGGA